jgi:uncharacterized protein YjdB
MATRPRVRNLTSNGVDILNAIRNNASQNYRDYIPEADASLDTLRQIGNTIMNMPMIRNEFLSALVDRIGRVIVTSRLWSNPWSVFKKGYLEYGETIEEIFVNIAKPFEYDPEKAETNLFKREIPDVRSAFHILNYQKFYKTTVQEKDLRQAFLSWDGVSDLIARIIDSMTTGANYDEFLVMKYLIARQLLDGRFIPTEVDAVSTANMKSIITKVKSVSNKLTFLNSEYNLAGVMNHAPKQNQYIIINSDFDALMDVEVLASAFNMDKTEFTGHRILIDSFGSLDKERLTQLFADDPAFTEDMIPTDAELEALDAIPAVMIDGDYFQIYDNLEEMTSDYNGEGLNYQYWLHTWKIVSASPFAQRTAFVPDTPSITSVTVTPATATIGVGQSVALSAEVAVTGFAPKSVIWTIAEADAEKAKVSAEGVVTGLSAGEVVVTATSTYDDTVTGTATITIA